MPRTFPNPGWRWLSGIVLAISAAILLAANQSTALAFSFQIQVNSLSGDAHGRYRTMLVEALTRDEAFEVVSEHAEGDDARVILVVGGHIRRDAPDDAEYRLEFQSKSEGLPFDGFFIDQALRLSSEAESLFVSQLLGIAWASIEPNDINQATLIASRLESLALELSDLTKAPPSGLFRHQMIGLNVALGFAASRLAGLPEYQDGERWHEEAARAFRTALNQSTEVSTSENRLTLKYNLGLALLASASKTKNPARLKEAEMIFREVMDAEAARGLGRQFQFYARFNLARAQFEQAVAPGQSSATEFLLQDIRLLFAPCERLQIQNCEAALQAQLADTLALVGERSGDQGYVRKALEVYRGLAQVWTRQRAPLRWRSLQNHLGSTLQLLATLTGEEGRQQEALTVFLDVLDDTDQETMPSAWASLTNNVGRVLLSLGAMDGDSGIVDQAIEHFQRSLDVFERDQYPNQWAIIQRNLGEAYGTLAHIQPAPGAIMEALEAYGRTQDVWTRASAAYEWAEIQVKRGRLLRKLYDLKKDIALLKQAIAAAQSTLDLWTVGQHPDIWIAVRMDLGSLLNDLGRRTGNANAFQSAVNTMLQALTVMNPENRPEYWAAMTNNLGNSLLGLGQVTGSHPHLEEAMAAFKATQKIWSRPKRPRDWAIAQLNIGIVQETMGTRMQRRADLRNALSSYDIAASVLHTHGFSEQVRIVETRRQRARLLLQKLHVNSTEASTEPKNAYFGVPA
jgi:tetratricopeptide (TPR) repeat protein